MARTKRFKTVAGYLRSTGDNAYYAAQEAKRAGRPLHSERDARRRILNALFPQIGIKDQIGPTEKPIDVVTRLRRAPENEKQAKNLDTILQWLRRRLGPRVQFLGATAESWGVIRGGEEFTGEEFDAIEKLASESGISFDEAKRMHRCR
jgi:hypothetical protein